MSKRRRTPEAPAYPFPFLAAEDETPASAVIAEEVSEAAAPILEQLLYEVQSWLHAPAGERRILGEASDVSHLPESLARPVRRTFELLREEPDPETQAAVALGVLLVSQWAETEAHAIRTAVVFSQAGLLLLPKNVAVAYQIGRLLRRVGAGDQAEVWLTHAVEKATTARDWEHRALALSGLGNLKRERGNFPEAVRFHRMALRSAREHGVRRLEGDALYDLAVMHFESGELDGGMQYAREAVAAYGPGHSQLVRLANDLAWIWMHLHGEAGLALELFGAIEPCVQDPPFRAVLLANIARAAAEEAQAHGYELAWMEAYAYMRKQETEDGHAAALGQLALAALASMQLERARQAAKLCLETAERRREGRMILMAEQILDALRDGLPEPEQMKELFPAFTLEESEIDPEERVRDEDFAATLSNALRARKDDAPVSPVRALVRGR